MPPLLLQSLPRRAAGGQRSRSGLAVVWMPGFSFAPTHLQWPRAAAASAGLALTSLLYPPQCIACGAAASEDHGVCAPCWRSIRFISRPYCERLGTPFAVDIGGPLVSPAAIADPPVFRCARAVAAHEGAARELVHKMKFGDREDLAKAMGGMMAAAGAEILRTAELLIPVPLHWTRLWQRRFNQSAALSRAVSAIAGVATDTDTLKRVKRTRTQVGLTKAERRANLQGAFRIDPSNRSAVAGRAVVLIDDVLTSSATANACARILLRAGTRQVDVLTFAMVCPEH